MYSGNELLPSLLPIQSLYTGVTHSCLPWTQTHTTHSYHTAHMPHTHIPHHTHTPYTLYIHHSPNSAHHIGHRPSTSLIHHTRMPHIYSTHCIYVIFHTDDTYVLHTHPHHPLCINSAPHATQHTTYTHIFKRHLFERESTPA